MAALTAEAQTVEPEYRAALAAEALASDPDVIASGSDGEGAELRSLRSRVSMGRYVSAALEMRSVEGAEREFNDALKLGMPGAFPVSMLAPELRAETDIDTATNSPRWVDRVFAEAAAQRLGVTFDSVPPGVTTYPVTTAGATGAQRGREEAAGAAVWTTETKELKPTRNSVYLEYALEDSYRNPGLDAALMRDLRAALVDAVDAAIFKGDAGANEGTADITGLTTATIGESTISQANKTDGQDWVALFAALIDGRYATTPGQLNIVSSVGSNVLWMSQLARSGNNVTDTVAQMLRTAGFNWTVRGDIDTATLAGDFGAFVGLQRGIEGAAVAPMWAEGVLERDSSGAAAGQRKIALHTFWGFGLARAGNFKRLKYVA